MRQHDIRDICMGKWLRYGVISTAIEMSSRSDGGTKEVVTDFSSLDVLQRRQPLSIF